MKKKIKSIPPALYIFLVLIVGLVSYFSSHHKEEARTPAAVAKPAP